MPVIHVDDQVADLEIAQVGQERLRGRPPALGDATLFFEDVGFRVDLQTGVREPEAARHVADGDEHRGVPCVLRALDRDGKHIVLLEELDCPLRATVGRGHKQRRLTLITQLADLGNPIDDPAVHLHGRLAADVRGGAIQSQRREIGRLQEIRVNGVPVGQQFRRRHRGVLPRQRLLVAVVQLFEQLRQVRTNLVALGDDDARVARACEVIENRRAAIAGQNVLQRHDPHVVDRADRPLRGRVVTAQRFNRVADKLEPHGLRFAGREDVDDAAADGELAVLVCRVFAAETGVDEQLAEIGRCNFLSWLQID